MAEKRANMTEKEKEEVKEKDRLRKKKMREKKKEEKMLDIQRRKKEGEFAHKGEYNRAKDKRLTQFGRYKEHKKAFDKRYKQKIRNQRSEVYHEFDKIENLLSQRMTREFRDGKDHLLDNLDAKRGMRALKEYGPIKDKPFMRRASREKDGEALWRGFWDRGESYQKVLLLNIPTLAAKFKEKDEEAQNKAKDEEKRKKEGHWIWDGGNEDYFWSIPDENGHQKSLSQYENELEANKPKLTPEEEEEKKKKEEEERKWLKEERKRENEETDRWYELRRKEKKEELARKQRERREKIKKELQKPIKLPIKNKEKGDYEKARDRTILERHNAMKESGMFEENELQAILSIIR